MKNTVQYTYEKMLDDQGNTIGIKRLEDMAGIPIDPANADYQAYLASLEETNGNN